MRSENYYPGNKNIPGLIHKIINQIPPFKSFYEPFAGSAAVSSFLSLRSMAQLNFVINDIDRSVTDQMNYPAGSTVTNQPASDLLQSLLSKAAGKDTFVFLDPPYTFDSRPNSLGLYSHNLTDSEHEQLLLTLLELKCNCMIIHPRCDLYDRILSSFRQVQVTVRYHNKTSRECLYCNYPEPDQLFTYDLYGTDCWDRQRIKRKGDRLLEKLKALPALERNYIISRLSFLP